MDLFELRNNRAFPTVHALMIEPFKSIWEADTSEGKERALKVFSYVELVCSPKKSNPFVGYSEEIRPKKVKKEVFGDEDYHTTEYMMLATIRYIELLNDSSPTYSLFDAALIAKDKLVNYLTTFNLAERNKAGMPVVKPQDITKTLSEIPDTAKSLVETRERVHQELLEETKTRNQREIGQYER